MKKFFAIELLRKKHYFDPILEIYYWKDTSGLEVDFVLARGPEVMQLIQVCYDLENIITRERELKSLVKASKELECTDLLVITWDYEGEEDFKCSRVRFVPMWKWLLG